jgi:diguanylate cyclase (GGDEF)-like protein
MEDRILSSVVEITEQRNTISLGHCLVATMTEMMPVKYASLKHFINSTAVIVAEVSYDEESHSFHWYYDQSVESCHHNHESNEIVSFQGEKGETIYQFPIPISDDSSVVLHVEMKGSIDEYKLLIDGFAKIYKNYLIVLHESERDKLTGLLNRRTLEERLSHCFDIASTSPGDLNLWVAIVDLDHFKQINDTYGHMIGDEVLLMFAQQMQSYFSNREQLFRFGGEEFVILLPPQDKRSVISMLNGFRQHIELYRFPQVEQITLSCGVCAISNNEYLPTILDHADKALYLAKESGRNQIQCYEDIASERDSDAESDPFDDVELF